MTHTIELKKRADLGTRNAKISRKQSLVPGVIYGENIASRNFLISETEILKLKKEDAGTGLLDVQVEGEEPVKAVIQDWQADPVTGRYRHLDLYQVRMDKTLRTEIQLEFTGIAPAVKDLGGTLVKQMDSLSVECLPGDLVHSINVDVSGLREFNNVIRVSDLAIPKGIALEDEAEANAIIVSVSEPRSEAELAELSAAPVTGDLEAVEVAAKGKKEEEGEEGESKAPEAKK